MILTEKEAATKVCKRDHSKNCLGSRCMGWEWLDLTMRRDGKTFVTVLNEYGDPIGQHQHLELRRGGCELKL